MLRKPRKIASVRPQRVKGVAVRITLYSNRVPWVATTAELINTVYSTLRQIAGMIEPLSENSRTRMEGFCGWMIMRGKPWQWRENIRATVRQRRLR
ncbi:hypothetical protein D3C76_1181470 [compost metagenome]